MTTTSVPPITLDLGPTLTISHLAVLVKAPLYTVRQMLRIAAVIAAGAECSSHAAMLELADAYGRAAQAGQYSELIRTEMLTAELRARRLADHLT